MRLAWRLCALRGALADPRPSRDDADDTRLFRRGMPGTTRVAGRASTSEIDGQERWGHLERSWLLRLGESGENCA